MGTVIKFLSTYLKKEVSSAPIIIFRIAFGFLMFISVSRFILKGWVYNMYIAPKLFFPFFGWEWIQPLPAFGMYAVFALLLLASLGILFAAFYRFSTILFFVLFTYVELIDKTNYLNHYYFVSLVSFILIFIPAGSSFSLDNKWFKKAEVDRIPNHFIFLLQLQLFLVYFFAGVAKLNSDWLFEAQPLKIWLPAFSHYYLIGDFMEKSWLAYVFCWFGCIYDLVIGFLLFNKRTVNIAYFFVVIFHLFTALFFNIGMFPFIMITITIIFFKEEFHLKLLKHLKTLVRYSPVYQLNYSDINFNRFFKFLFGFFIVVQILLPFRYLLYSGKLFWTEQGYRFSWRVMLMEKAGTVFFYVKDAQSNRVTMIDNKEYLTYMQEKMVSTQPDMMVDYAKYLKKEFTAKGFSNPIVTAECYVTVNGSGTREFFDPNLDLSIQNNSIFSSKTWIRSY